MSRIFFIKRRGACEKDFCRKTMMCLAASIPSFVGKVYYSLDAPSDGAAKWAVKSWNDYHVTSSFCLPEIKSGILKSESKALFKR